MRPKVIIVYNRLFHYRIPIWNILSNYCDLTVMEINQRTLNADLKPYIFL